MALFQGTIPQSESGETFAPSEVPLFLPPTRVADQVLTEFPLLNLGPTEFDSPDGIPAIEPGLFGINKDADLLLNGSKFSQNGSPLAIAELSGFTDDLGNPTINGLPAETKLLIDGLPSIGFGPILPTIIPQQNGSEDLEKTLQEALRNSQRRVEFEQNKAATERFRAIGDVLEGAESGLQAGVDAVTDIAEGVPGLISDILGPLLPFAVAAAVIAVAVVVKK